MYIRRANSKDLGAVADLYDIGRQTMAQHNNTFQWTKNYPLLEDAVADYENRGLFVVCEENKPEEILGCFSLLPGPDEEYANITEGAWINDLDYVVIHRVAVKYTGSGIASFMFNWICENYSNVRVDTHEANVAMTTTLTHAGFVYCGKVVGHDKTPRDAFSFCSLIDSEKRFEQKESLHMKCLPFLRHEK